MKRNLKSAIALSIALFAAPAIADSIVKIQERTTANERITLLKSDSYYAAEIVANVESAAYDKDYKAVLRKRGAKSVLALIMFSCYAQEYKHLATALFPERNGEGSALVRETYTNQPIKPIAPNSLSAVAFEMACSI